MSTRTLLAPGNYYHIYNRGINSGQVFFEKQSYTLFLKLYAKYMFQVFDTYAYCLLGNHYHFLIKVKTIDEQLSFLKSEVNMGLRDSKIPINESLLKPPHQHFNNMQIAFTKSINKRFNRTGGLMEQPFHRKSIDNSTYLLNLTAYIHQNPQKHGLIKDFREWPWSSYGAYLSQQETRLEKEITLEWFGGKRDFVDFHQTSADTDLIEPLIGDDLF